MKTSYQREKGKTMEEKHAKQEIKEMDLYFNNKIHLYLANIYLGGYYKKYYPAKLYFYI